MTKYKKLQRIKQRKSYRQAQSKALGTGSKTNPIYSKSRTRGLPTSIKIHTKKLYKKRTEVM